jgi:hypothetical protein
MMGGPRNRLTQWAGSRSGPLSSIRIFYNPDARKLAGSAPTKWLARPPRSLNI